MNFRSLAAWILVSSAYAIAFFQRMASQSMNNALMDEFNISSSEVAFIASGYFWGYAIMQIPAGPLVDRFGLRKMILISTLVSAVGSLVFALSQSPLMAFSSRILLACGDSIVFTSLLKLVSLKFKDKNFGLMSGLSQASGYIGGAISAAPLAIAVSSIGISKTFTGISFIVFGIFFGCYLCVEKTSPTTEKFTIMRSLNIVLIQIIKSRAFFGIAIVNASHFSIVTILAGVWGLPMISHYFQISPSSAGMGIIIFMLGNIIGSILIGKMVDMVKDVSKLLSWIYLARTLLILLLTPLIAKQVGIIAIFFDLLIFGILAGGSIPPILFIVRKIFSSSLVSTGASICMTLAGVITSILIPIIAKMMLFVPNVSSNGTLTDSELNILIFILITISISGLVATFWIRDRYTFNKALSI